MEKKRPIALFDFDGTIARGDSIGAFMKYIFSNYYKSLIELVRIGFYAVPYGLGIVSKKKMKTVVLQLTNHIPKDKIDEFIKAFINDSIKPSYFSAGLEKVKWHREQGHLLVMVSASMDIYMKEVCKDLGFDELICTNTSLKPRPAVTGVNCYGIEKITRLKQSDFFEDTDWENSYAYSDHHSDIPMMELCGNKIATTPTKKLKSHARKNGWKIVDWS